VVGEELEGDDLEDGQEQLGGGGDVDDMFDKLGEPIVMERSSSSEWSSSGKVWARGSSNTVVASRKETRCFLRLAAALSGSNSKLRGGKFMRWLPVPF
jgi:hypothetical protein